MGWAVGVLFMLACAALTFWALSSPAVVPVPVSSDAEHGDWFADSFVDAIGQSIEKREGVWVSHFEIRQVLKELGERGHLVVVDVDPNAHAMDLRPF